MSRQFKNSHNKKHTREYSQSGGSGTGYASLWYSPTPSNIHQLSNITAKGLETTPMFNPLKPNAPFATPTSGVIPTGIHLANTPSPTNYYQTSKPLYLTGGGGKLKRVKNEEEPEWETFAKIYAKKHNMSYQRALTNPECKTLYHIYSGQ